MKTIKYLLGKIREDLVRLRDYFKEMDQFGKIRFFITAMAVIQLASGIFGLTIGSYAGAAFNFTVVVWVGVLIKVIKQTEEYRNLLKDSINVSDNLFDVLEKTREAYKEAIAMQDKEISEIREQRDAAIHERDELIRANNLAE